MKRMLVIHTGGGLGDVLLSTCVVHALQDHYQVDFLCNRSTSAALNDNPEIHDLLLIDRKAPRLGKEFFEWVKTLKNRRSDAARVLWSTGLLAWMLWAAGIPVRVGQGSRLLYSFLYTHKVRIRSEHGDEQSHWTEILLDYVRALGIAPGPPHVRLEIPESARQAAQHLIAGARRPLIGFHSSKGIKVGPDRWPVDVFAKLARHIEERFQATLVLTGSKNEAELVAPIERQLANPINLCGKTDLQTLAAVAEACDVFVCPDSGPMHVAAAAGTNVVGIYALDEDFPKRWAPFTPKARVIRPAHRNCRPGCVKATCPDFRCYRQVDPQAVAAAVEELLGG